MNRRLSTLITGAALASSLIGNAFGATANLKVACEGEYEAEYGTEKYPDYDQVNIQTNINGSEVEAVKQALLQLNGKEAVLEDNIQTAFSYNTFYTFAWIHGGVTRSTISFQTKAVSGVDIKTYDSDGNLKVDYSTEELIRLTVTGKVYGPKHDLVLGGVKKVEGTEVVLTEETYTYYVSPTYLTKTDDIEIDLHEPRIENMRPNIWGTADSAIEKRATTAQLVNSIAANVKGHNGEVPTLKSISALTLDPDSCDIIVTSNP